MKAKTKFVKLWSILLALAMVVGMHGFVLLGASCLRINVAVEKFFYEFAHIVTSFDFLP